MTNPGTLAAQIAATLARWNDCTLVAAPFMAGQGSKVDSLLVFPPARHPRIEVWMRSAVEYRATRWGRSSRETGEAEAEEATAGVDGRGHESN